MLHYDEHGIKTVVLSGNKSRAVYGHSHALHIQGREVYKTGEPSRTF
jgi:hypothetical protein